MASPTDRDPYPRHRVPAAAVGDEGLDAVVVATAAERDALAEADGLRGLGSLVGTFHVSREGKRGLKVTGTVEARVTQDCVATLEPFDGVVVGPVEVHFLPEDDIRGLAAARKGRADADEAEQDAPDPIVDGTIDLGALLAEFLALNLDPYPRKPDAVFAEPAAADRDPSPFAVLERLKPKGGASP